MKVHPPPTRTRRGGLLGHRGGGREVRGDEHGLHPQRGAGHGDAVRACFLSFDWVTFKPLTANVDEWTAAVTVRSRNLEKRDMIDNFKKLLVKYYHHSQQNALLNIKTLKIVARASV